VATLALAATSAAQSPGSGGSGPAGADADAEWAGLAVFHLQVAEAFYSLDRDRSGRLERTELGSAESESFDRADLDDDGALSLNEYVEARFEELAGRGVDPEDRSGEP
jgi:hypothetical protein